MSLADFPDRDNPRLWDAYREKLGAAFRTKTQAAWTEIFAGTDACVAPVLTMSEAAVSRHAQSRHAFVDVAGIMQPAPAPRFSRTPSATPLPPPAPGEHTREVLLQMGRSPAEIERLAKAGVVQVVG
jgi:alpha-methylacyl-CoA racemase